MADIAGGAHRVALEKALLVEPVAPALGGHDRSRSAIGRFVQAGHAGDVLRWVSVSESEERLQPLEQDGHWTRGGARAGRRTMYWLRSSLPRMPSSVQLSAQQEQPMSCHDDMAAAGRSGGRRRAFFGRQHYWPEEEPSRLLDESNEASNP